MRGDEEEEGEREGEEGKRGPEQDGPENVSLTRLPIFNIH